jgi:hypothetical protein
MMTIRVDPSKTDMFRSLMAQGELLRDCKVLELRVFLAAGPSCLLVSVVKWSSYADFESAFRKGEVHRIFQFYAAGYLAPPNVLGTGPPRWQYGQDPVQVSAQLRASFLLPFLLFCCFSSPPHHITPLIRFSLPHAARTPSKSRRSSVRLLFRFLCFLAVHGPHPPHPPTHPLAPSLHPSTSPAHTTLPPPSLVDITCPFLPPYPPNPPRPLLPGLVWFDGLAKRCASTSGTRGHMQTGLALKASLDRVSGVDGVLDGVVAIECADRLSLSAASPRRSLRMLSCLQSLRRCCALQR